MLKLRKEQLEQLSAYARASFVLYMRDRVRRHFPARTAAMSDGDVDGAIEQGISSASGYGIRDQHDVERYVYLMFAVGFDFDSEASATPWAGEILRRSESTAKLRMDMLCAIYEGRFLQGPDDNPIFP